MTDKDYAENLKIIDQITNKMFNQDSLCQHRKSISQPYLLQPSRQPDRFDMTLPFTISLQLYPMIFKYVRIKVKDTLKPLHCSYESSNGLASIKIFISRTHDSPNILNNHLQLLNKPRFQFTEPPAQINKFQCEFVYLSIYADKYTEIKLKGHASTIILPNVIQRKAVKKEIPFPWETIHLNTSPTCLTTRPLVSDHVKGRKNNSLKKFQKIKFQTLHSSSSRMKSQRMGSPQPKIDEVIEKKKVIFQRRHQFLIENSYFSELNRLSSRVSRLQNEIQGHVNLLDSEWFELLYSVLLAERIRQMYFKRVRRIVILNKVQVCCRKFLRIMKSKLSYNHRAAMHLDCDLSLTAFAMALKDKTKKNAEKLIHNFLFIYSYQSDGMKKVYAFSKHVHYIQQKWRTFKKNETTYIQKSVFIIHQKWYQMYKQLSQENHLSKDTPQLDKQHLQSIFKQHLEQYKKHFCQSVKLVEQLKMGHNLQLFRPLTNTIIKEIILFYMESQKKIKK